MEPIDTDPCSAAASPYSRLSSALRSAVRPRVLLASSLLLTGGALVLSSSAVAGESSEQPPDAKADDGTKTARDSKDAAPKTKAEAAAPTGIAPADLKRLREWLAAVGAADAPVELMARSAQRQARIMYTLASEDADAAREMYCAAGDAVIDRFDPSKSRDANIATMQQELIAQLPEARNIGCLDHIENDDVYAVDVDAEAIPSERHAALVAAAKRAVAAGELHGFRHPPSHRGAFHFEFDRNPPSSSASDEQTPAGKKAPAAADETPPSDSKDDKATEDSAAPHRKNADAPGSNATPKQGTP